MKCDTKKIADQWDRFMYDEEKVFRNKLTDVSKNKHYIQEGMSHPIPFEERFDKHHLIYSKCAEIHMYSKYGDHILDLFDQMDIRNTLLNMCANDLILFDEWMEFLRYEEYDFYTAIDSLHHIPGGFYLTLSKIPYIQRFVVKGVRLAFSYNSSSLTTDHIFFTYEPDSKNKGKRKRADEW